MAFFGSKADTLENRDGMPSITIAMSELEAGIGVLELFARTDLASTNSEARRLVQGGGAWIGDQKVDDPRAVIDPSFLDEHDELILRSGKKRYFRVIVER